VASCKEILKQDAKATSRAVKILSLASGIDLEDFFGRVGNLGRLKELVFARLPKGANIIE